MSALTFDPWALTKMQVERVLTANPANAANPDAGAKPGLAA